MKSAAAVLVFLGLGLSPAAACGWLNERCCSGAVACKVDGLVCIDGRCKEGPCGGNGEVCCADEACDLHSLVCLGGSCTPCGKEGEPVCNEDGVSPCNEGLEPSGGICAVICGDAGWPCCEDNSCKVDGLTCVDGTCSECGSENEPVCDDAPACEGDLVDVGGICTAPPPCGAAGEICCPPDDGCDSHSLACVSGTCTPCGAAGEPVCTEDGVSPCNSGLEDRDSICDVIDCGDKGKACCSDDSCNMATLFCSAGTCLPCGTTGVQVCTGEGAAPCEAGLVDIAGFCQPPPEDCGEQGQPCCDGKDCSADGTGCLNGICLGCGTNGRPACPGDEPCEEGLTVSPAGACTGGKKEAPPRKW